MAKTKEKPEIKASKKPSKPAGQPASKSTKAKSPKAKARSIPENECCDFCDKSSKEMKNYIIGPTHIHICDECIELCVAILFEDNKDEWIPRLINIISDKYNSPSYSKYFKSIKKGKLNGRT